MRKYLFLKNSDNNKNLNKNNNENNIQKGNAKL